MVKKTSWIIGLYFFMSFIVSLATADEIHLKDGRIISVKSYWEEDQSICYQKFGATIKIQKFKIQEIKSEDSNDEASQHAASNKYHQLVNGLEETTKDQLENEIKRLEKLEIEISEISKRIENNKFTFDQIEYDINQIEVNVKRSKKDREAYRKLGNKKRRLGRYIRTDERDLNKLMTRRKRLIDFIERNNDRDFKNKVNVSD